MKEPGEIEKEVRDIIMAQDALGAKEDASFDTEYREHVCGLLKIIDTEREAREKLEKLIEWHKQDTHEAMEWKRSLEAELATLRAELAKEKARVDKNTTLMLKAAEQNLKLKKEAFEWDRQVKALTEKMRQH